MREIAQSSRLVAIVFLLFLTTFVSRACHASEPSATSGNVVFSYSTESTEVVFRLTYRGGMTGIHPSYTLFGDGRLEYRKVDLHGKVYEAYDYSMPHAEMMSLLQGAAESGLMRSSSALIEQKVRTERSGKISRVEDGVDLIIQLQLEDYVENGQRTDSVSVRLVVHEPAYLARFYNVEELRVLAEIERKMRDAFSKAQLEE